MDDANRILERALTAYGAGHSAEAAALCRAALSLEPANAGGWHLYGILAASPHMIRHTLHLNPANAAAHAHLAQLDLSQRTANGRTRWHSMLALVLHPSNGDGCDAAGQLAYRFNDYRRAIGWLLRAHYLFPAKAETLVNLGAVLRDARQFDGAETAYSAAIARRPDLTEAHLGRAVTRLVRGDLRGGWEDFEHRWKRYPTPPWNGEAVAGKTILLHAEQGFGDTIQFARYAPLLADRGANVIMAVHPALVRLLRRLDPRVTILAQDRDPLPTHDFHCPLLSLPRGFRTTLETIPAATAYLTADPADRAAADQKIHGSLIPPEPRPLNVGLVWAGNPAHKNDHNRSLPCGTLAALTMLDGVTLWSLQTGPAAMATPAALPRLLDGVQDFADTAARVAALDLVITVDTAMAHLAGALGVPCWMLLPYAPDWRWLAIPADNPRQDTPWYPAMRLFRQPRPNDWAEPIGAIAALLRAHIARQDRHDSPAGTEGH